MKNLSKNSLLLAYMAFIFFSGCKKDTPVTTDTIPPSMSLTISGGGTSKTFTDAGDYSTGIFNLKPSTKYTITSSVADSGGVQSLRLTLAKLLISQNITGAPANTVTETSFDRNYSIAGSASDPYKSFLLSGNFVTPDAANGSFSFTISSNGRDYRPNLSTVLVNVNVEDNPVGGYGWVTF